MKTPNPHFDREKYDELPAEYHEPKLDFSFDEIDAAADLDREEIVNLDRLWTTLIRAWEGIRIPLSPTEVAEIVDVYLDREQRLDPDEREKVETYLVEIGALRSPDRSFEALTGIEFEIIIILRGRARQDLSSDELVSSALYPDDDRDREQRHALDLRDAFETKTLSFLADDEPEPDADADEQDDMGGER